MRFSPKSEEELAESGNGKFEPFPAGEYDIEVVNAADDVSKNGVDQLKLSVAIYNSAGAKRQVFEYLSSSAKAVWKIKEFADCVGMTDAYERGEMHPEDLVGRTGKARVIIERNAQYGDRNKVAAYLSRHPVASGMTFGPGKPAPARKHDDLNDDVPF